MLKTTLRVTNSALSNLKNVCIFMPVALASFKKGNRMKATITSLYLLVVLCHVNIWTLLRIRFCNFLSGLTVLRKLGTRLTSS